MPYLTTIFSGRSWEKSLRPIDGPRDEPKPHWHVLSVLGSWVQNCLCPQWLAVNARSILILIIREATNKTKFMYMPTKRAQTTDRNIWQPYLSYFLSAINLYTLYRSCCGGSLAFWIFPAKMLEVIAQITKVVSEQCAIWSFCWMFVAHVPHHLCNLLSLAFLHPVSDPFTGGFFAGRCHHTRGSARQIQLFRLRAGPRTPGVSGAPRAGWFGRLLGCLDHWSWSYLDITPFQVIAKIWNTVFHQAFRRMCILQFVHHITDPLVLGFGHSGFDAWTLSFLHLLGGYHGCLLRTRQGRELHRLSRLGFRLGLRLARLGFHHSAFGLALHDLLHLQRLSTRVSDVQTNATTALGHRVHTCSRVFATTTTTTHQQ